MSVERVTVDGQPDLTVVVSNTQEQQTEHSTNQTNVPEAAPDPHPPTIEPVSDPATPASAASNAINCVTHETASASCTGHTVRSWPPRRLADEVLERVVSAIDEKAWFADVTFLSCINRWHLSEEIQQTREWLVGELVSIEGAVVKTQTIPLELNLPFHGRHTAYSPDSSGGINIIATLPGEVEAPYIVIGAHYDSMSEIPSERAPGAVDNASGVAGVIQLARIFSQFKRHYTMEFVLFDAEEFGLIGSKYRTSLLTPSDVLFMINLDMIAWRDATPMLLFQTQSEALGRLCCDTASKLEAKQIPIVETNAWGSDHVPYIRQGIPAVMVSFEDGLSYPFHHRTQDLPENIEPSIAKEILSIVACILALVGVHNVDMEIPIDLQGFSQLLVKDENHVQLENSSCSLPSDVPSPEVQHTDPSPQPPTSQVTNNIVNHVTCEKIPVPQLCDESLNRLVSSLDERSWLSDISHLTSVNRYALSQEMGELRNWLLDKLKSIDGLVVTTEPVPLKDGFSGLNLAGTVPGSVPTRIVVGAHYDSTSENKHHRAPGAADNASGAAAVLQLAQIFARTHPVYTMEFVLFDGEEIGTCGSRKRVTGLQTTDVLFMINIDMIGVNEAHPVFVTETSPAFEFLANMFCAISRKLKPTALIKVETFAWGSDHMPYIGKDIPAVLITFNDSTSYEHYHTTRDTIEHLNPGIALDYMRVIACGVGLVGLYQLDIYTSLDEQGFTQLLQSP